MKALRLHRYGKTSNARLEEVPAPTPGPGDLLVDVRAASVNPVDLKICEGKVKALVNYKTPFTLGNDLSGVVRAFGKDVLGFKPGDEIFARLGKDRIGAFAEQALVVAKDAARKPPRLSHVEAASIPLVGLTAWQAMIELGGLAPGQKVLIHAGSGGVGTFAIQLARHLGAHVFTTAGSRNKDLLLKLGAERVIDYKTERFEDVIQDADVVFDTQGGETLMRSFAAVKLGGRVISVNGYPDAKFARAWGMNPLLVLALSVMMGKVTRAAKRRGAQFDYLFMRADGAQLQLIGDLLEKRIIDPVIDRTFPLDRFAEALSYSEAGRTTGKVVLTV